MLNKETKLETVEVAVEVTVEVTVEVEVAGAGLSCVSPPANAKQDETPFGGAGLELTLDFLYQPLHL